MMSLITLGISVAYIYSMYAFINNTILHSDIHVMDFFWELTSLIIIMLLGHWIEMKSVANAGNTLQKLAELLPNSALLLKENGEFVKTPLSEVEIGDILKVLPGEKIPTDGIISQGKTSVNESMVTGESREVSKTVEDIVIGGSINGSGTVLIKVTGTGESGYLAQVMQLVSNAQNDSSKVELLSDKVAGGLFYFAVSVGIIAFVVWITIGYGLDFALERLVTVLVIACPHALGLAVPLVTARSTSLAAQRGLLIQKRESLEIANKINIVAMDKTGTLTKGNFAVSEYKSLTDDYSDDEILRIMSTLEEGSSHPLAIGILNKLKEKNLKTFKSENINNIQGVGLEGDINGKKYKIVNRAYLIENKVSFDEEKFNEIAGRGNSVSYLLEEEKVVGIVGQGDEIREESKNLIEILKSKNMKTVMLTGDNKKIADIVGEKLNLDYIYSETKPEDKEEIIKNFQADGKKVMMVGDGVNDAPSLVRADIGMAIGAGTDIAIDSADVILVKSNPEDIVSFFNLAENTSRKMVQNLWWGAGYNLIAVPLAAGVLAKFGFILSPAVGAILMSLSTVVVTINAMTLKIK